MLKPAVQLAIFGAATVSGLGANMLANKVLEKPKEAVIQESEEKVNGKFTEALHKATKIAVPMGVFGLSVAAGALAFDGTKKQLTEYAEYVPFLNEDSDEE